MPTVWLRGDPRYRTRFHRTPTCYQLTKGPARGPGHELFAVDLSEVYVRPCQICYPDAPRTEVLHTYCPVCDSRHPCEHNGAVLVTTSFWQRRWVWPDCNQMPYYREYS